MVAPEKIYFQVCGDCYGNEEDCRNCKFHNVEDSVTWSKERIYDDDIEYTRTDAFIEKAKSWFDEIENGTTIIDIEAFFNDFKKYMKG